MPSSKNRGTHHKNAPPKKRANTIGPGGRTMAKYDTAKNHYQSQDKDKVGEEVQEYLEKPLHEKNEYLKKTQKVCENTIFKNRLNFWGKNNIIAVLERSFEIRYITENQKKVILYLNTFFKHGRIVFTKQTEIAKKLELNRVHLIDILQALESKKIIILQKVKLRKDGFACVIFPSIPKESINKKQQKQLEKVLRGSKIYLKNKSEMHIQHG